MRIPTLVPVLLALLLSTQSVAAEELVLIVHRDSGISTLSREQASHLFLGRVKMLPSGLKVMVVPRSVHSPTTSTCEVGAPLL